MLRQCLSTVQNACLPCAVGVSSGANTSAYLKYVLHSIQTPSLTISAVLAPYTGSITQKTKHDKKTR